MKLYYKRVDFRVMSHCFNLSTLSTIFQNQKAVWLLANQHSKVGVGGRSGGRGKQIANWAFWATIKNFCVKVMYTQCLCSSQLTMQLRQAKQVWDEPCYAREAKRRLSNVSYIKNFAKVIWNIFQIAISSSLGQPKQVWDYGYVVLGKQIGSRAPSISSQSPTPPPPLNTEPQPSPLLSPLYILPPQSCCQ